MKMPGSVTVFVNHFFGFPKTCTKLAVLLHVFVQIRLICTFFCTKQVILLHVFGKQVRDRAEARRSGCGTGRRRRLIMQKEGGMQAICLKKKKSAYSRIRACAKSNVRRARGIL